ncbi:MAG: endopeptidase La [Clostridia bacterium]|nr:endopeptidase La [Clostridia bacterium]
MSNTHKKLTLPMIPLRGLVVLPYMVLHFDVGRQKSINALEKAMEQDKLVFLVTQFDENISDPTPHQLYQVGTIAKITQVLHMSGKVVRVLVEGINRAELLTAYGHDYFTAEILECNPETLVKYSDNVEALVRKLRTAFEKFTELSGKVSPEAFASMLITEDPGRMCDIIAGNLDLPIKDKQIILDSLDPKERLENLLIILNRECEIAKLSADIDMKVKSAMEENQRDYFLREQLKVIQEELGDKDGIMGEVNEYREKLDKMNLPEEVMEKADREISKLIKTPAGMGEGTVIRNYLDLLCQLPWGVYTRDSIDVKKAEKVLERDHYGLSKVKERILEYLAVRKLAPDAKAPILCLVGPPGVGKTSIAKSIAKAMNKKYVRIALGGVRDEAEIRGHRRTYLGSMPGRIINAIKQAGSSNPLMLFDEIDKLCADNHGDPSSAMLEVLDSEQNSTFRDNYLELPYDLSRVTFITTANQLDTIPRPLLDRMELIEISGYVMEEKFNIAKKHLIPKQYKMYGLTKATLKISDDALYDIINYYTREAGVRNLEREIGSLCRKVAKKIVSEDKKSISITSRNLTDYLGSHKYTFEKMKTSPSVGIATGLAWTQVGGETLEIEVNVMQGSGKTELTGQLGDIMKESAMTAISYIRSKAEDYKISPDFYKTCDIHIHVPEGATPKDGPSAGITMATALISALSGYAVKSDVAMTGEITLRGRVLPIGGLKEKSIAAFRSGVRTVIIPQDNVKDLEDIPSNIKEQINFIPVSSIEQVLKTALCKIPEKSAFSVNSNMMAHTIPPKSMEISNRI